MTRFFLFIAIIGLLASCATVGQNEEAFHYNSWDGTVSEAIFNGGTYSAMFVDFYSHDLTTQKLKYESEILTEQGLDITVVTTVNYRNLPGTVKRHHEIYRLDGENKFIEPTVTGTIKDVIGKYNPEQVYSTHRDSIESEIRNYVNQKFEQTGLFRLEMLEILDVDLPQGIQSAIEQKVKQEQTTMRKIEEANTKEAEGRSIVAAAKARVEAAKHEAEANRIKSASITPNIIKMEELKIKKAQVEKWNGVMPVYSMGDKADILMQLK